jgi:hypothetical protein
MILDADVLIDLVRERPAATAWFTTLPSMPSVSGIAALDLRHPLRVRPHGLL